MTLEYHAAMPFPPMTWREFLRRLIEDHGVQVRETSGGVAVLYRTVGAHHFYYPLPKDMNLPATPWVIGNLCEAMNLDPGLFLEE